jgi:hypothetical protein
MGPLIEALLIFVGIPVMLLATLATLAYTAVIAARSFATGSQTQTPANNVVAFRARPTPEVVRDLREAA